MRMGSKKSVLVTYGENEEKAFNNLADLSKSEIPNNKNEIFRRGVHCVNHLAEADECVLINQLHSLLRALAAEQDDTDKETVIALATVIQTVARCIGAVLAAKYGSERSIIFGRIVKDVDSIGLALTQSVKQRAVKSTRYAVPDEIQASAQKIVNALETVFL
jgi:hypothetical protein